MFEVGILPLVDRAALAAYCYAYARRVEAEESAGREARQCEE
ncbi:hypothetical protein [Antarctobacter heliothermus]|nr:hypothetical protein [Antarctobacter heliothermus]